MNKQRHWLITGAALLVAGLLTFTAAFEALGFDYKRLSAEKL